MLRAKMKNAKLTTRASVGVGWNMSHLLLQINYTLMKIYSSFNYFITSLLSWGFVVQYLTVCCYDVVHGLLIKGRACIRTRWVY